MMKLSYLFPKLLDVVTLLSNDASNLLPLHNQSYGESDRRTAISIVQGNFVRRFE